MKIALPFLALFFVQLVSAQDMTGIWRGSFNSSDRVLNMLNIEDQYKFEVQIEQDNKALSGVTYSYKTTVFYGKATANGSVNPKTGKVMLQEIKTVELKMQQNSYACIMTCMLQYTKNGDEEFLEGTYDSFGEKDSSRCGRGTVFLRKVKTSDFHKEPFLVKRSIEEQQREMLASNSKKTTTPGSSKSGARLAPPRPGSGKPGTAKTGTVKNTRSLPKKTVDSTAVAKSNKPAVPKPGVLKPAPGKKDSTAVARSVPPKPKPEALTPEPPARSPKPLENRSIPNLARTDSNASGVPEFKKTVSIPIPKVLATRENELVKTITLNTREVVVNLYDNGTIDHDTISVYLDKKLVISKQMLTTNPLTIKFTIDDNNDFHELVMVAENLGDIPPNTSLMVVKAGEQNIEVRITSTEQKNAVVAFRYKKPS